MTYSIIGILAAIILLIGNDDVLLKRDLGQLEPTQRCYRNFLVAVFCYYVTDAFWGVLDYYHLTSLQFLDTSVYFAAMVASVLLWTRYVVSYLEDEGSFGSTLLRAGNILFVPFVPGSEWVATVLPGRSPAELPVTGRRLIDYALERVRRFGFNFAEVLDWSFSERLSADFEEDEHAGFHVYYHRGAGDVPRGLAALENPSFPLAGKVVDGLTVIWGPCITSGEPDEISVEPLPPEACVQTPMGIYRREGGRWMRVRPKGLAAKDVRSWRRINLAVLENPDAFTLPGYTAERDVHIGRNVVLERGTQVGRPVLLNDDVWCARNVRIDRDVIIGRGAFVGEGAHLLRDLEWSEFARANKFVLGALTFVSDVEDLRDEKGYYDASAGSGESALAALKMLGAARLPVFCGLNRCALHKERRIWTSHDICLEENGNRGCRFR